jgi:hypothetical protein
VPKGPVFNFKVLASLCRYKIKCWVALSGSLKISKIVNLEKRRHDTTLCYKVTLNKTSTPYPISYWGISFLWLRVSLLICLSVWLCVSLWLYFSLRVRFRLMLSFPVVSYLPLIPDLDLDYRRLQREALAHFYQCHVDANSAH